MGNRQLDVVQDFRVEDYCGLWYEAYRTRGMRFEYGDCVTARYTLQPDGGFTVRNSLQEWGNFQDGDPVKDFRKGVEGWGYPKEAGAKDGHLGVKFSMF